MKMSTAVTILDYLNDDCWALVLGYVPVRDIIRTEQTSRRWQEVVLKYLSNVRIGLAFKDIKFRDYQSPAAFLPSRILHNVCWMNMSPGININFTSLHSWLMKLGASVVACVCTEFNLNFIGENCPNLEAVMFVALREEQLLNNQYEVFTRLRRLRFNDCCDVSDSCVSQFISSEVLEEFEIVENSRLSGECFMNIKSKNLKSLVFISCKAFASRLLAAADRLSELTQLVLFDCFDEEEESYEHLLPVLSKTPKLEYLFTSNNGKNRKQSLFEPICRLGCLRNLSVDSPATDRDLEALARFCPHLQSLCVSGDEVTGRGLAALCRLAGARLVSLKLPRARLTDDDVAGCVAACPNLKELNVLKCTLLTRGVLPRAALARRAVGARRQLCIHVTESDLRANEEEKGPIGKFEELELPYIFQGAYDIYN